MSKKKHATLAHRYVLLARLAIHPWERIFILIAIGIAALGFGGAYRAAAIETADVSTLPASIHRAAGNGPATTATPRLPHPIERDVYYKYCTRCHGVGKMKPFPANHRKFAAKSCLGCHEPGSAPRVKDSRVKKATGGKPGPVPHPILRDKYKDCTKCHGAGKLKPFPANHTAYDVKSCLGCHKSGSAPRVRDSRVKKATGGKPGPVPHPILRDKYKDCTKCHGAGKLKPFPGNHAGFVVESCTACHQPASGNQLQ